MRKGSTYVAAAIAVSAVLFSPLSASADPTPSPSPTLDTFRAAQEQYKKDREIYLSSLRDREIKLRAINASFKSAVDKAALEAKTALALATTPDQKHSINATRRAAITAAIVAREGAIANLGPLPTPPAEPLKPGKAAPFGMNEQKGRQKR